MPWTTGLAEAVNSIVRCGVNTGQTRLVKRTCVRNTIKTSLNKLIIIIHNKLTVTKRMEKRRAFYGTRKFSTVSTTARRWTPYSDPLRHITVAVWYMLTSISIILLSSHSGVARCLGALCVYWQQAPAKEITNVQKKFEISLFLCVQWFVEGRKYFYLM